MTDDALDDLELELALDAVLARYGIPAISLGPERVADRGDLASDLAAVARDFARRRSGPAGPRPPWHLTRKAFGYLSALVAGRGMRGRHELDQLQGTIRDALDEVGVNLHDEWAVYHGLVWAGMVVELARNGLDNEAIPRPVYDAIAEIVTTIGAALMEYAPEDVRG